MLFNIFISALDQGLLPGPIEECVDKLVLIKTSRVEMKDDFID